MEVSALVLLSLVTSGFLIDLFVFLFSSRSAWALLLRPSYPLSRVERSSGRVGRGWVTGAGIGAREDRKRGDGWIEREVGDSISFLCFTYNFRHGWICSTPTMGLETRIRHDQRSRDDERSA